VGSGAVRSRELCAVSAIGPGRAAMRIYRRRCWHRAEGAFWAGDGCRPRSARDARARSHPSPQREA